MALVIEDGTGIAGATSFVDVPDFRAWAEARGIVLPAEDAAVEILLVKAMDYLALTESKLVAARVTAEQALLWPREYYPAVTPAPTWYGTVPGAWKTAQMLLAAYAMTTDLIRVESPDDRGPVKAVTVGPIKTEYAGAGSSSTQPRFLAIESLLSPWYRSGVGSVNARAYRG
jgi:hypothetical protein